MKSLYPSFWHRLADPRWQVLLKILLALGLFFGCYLNAFADGVDILKGTDSNFWSTFNGTGKVYLYIGEAIIAIVMFIKSRNMIAFIGIISVAVFIDIFLHIAGQTS
ncbi:MAG TPA: hypothetical protein VHE99_11330 [Gammaproteobacteria bacterium]|nr:hypothetical protein [Gammaproteobacteria bacterium]